MRFLEFQYEKLLSFDSMEKLRIFLFRRGKNRTGREILNAEGKVLLLPSLKGNRKKYSSDILDKKEVHKCTTKDCTKWI